ncbi:uncharacterized protein LAESUDRAFT_196957 [Laetiporus sulphureus 93-53]|uniref:Uncharacterized protein n=1 Tax=Laetiporus sulphureus 93-53 TaxID=1314785 RepID=A0A165E1Y3_9APHY|nr:uncharacterized protein LAESUDRAFT_196957 [Laetiporus sulphureus 93-53]KZT06089.1 hypothetical protein LAESUDRAFT_196957 [Laetiporus sulphureus 93-53]
MEGISDAGFSGVQQNVDLHEPIEHRDDPYRSLMVDKRGGHSEVLRLIEIGTSSDGTADEADPSAALITVDLEERDPEASVRSEMKASSTAVAFESEDEADRSELSPFRRPTRLWKKVCESRVEMIINLYGIHAVRSAVEKEAIDYWSAQDARAESSTPSDSEASSASPHPTSAYRYRDTADSFEEPDSEPALTHSPSASIHDDDDSFMEWEPSEHSDDEDAGLIPDVDADPDSDDFDNRPVLRRSRAPSPEFAPFPTEAPSVVVVEENLPRLSSIPVRLTKEKVLVLRGTPACVAPWARGSLTPARVSS